MATELIFRDGMDAVSIDTLAARANCSRATIYRYVGGKKTFAKPCSRAPPPASSTSCVKAFRGRTGPDRVLTAIEVAVAQIHGARRAWVDLADRVSIVG